MDVHAGVFPSGAKAEPLAPQDELRALAAKLLKSAQGDVPKAVIALEKKVRANRKLRDALTDPLLRTACYDVIRYFVRQNRDVIWHTAQPDAEEMKKRATTLARGVHASLLDFPLPLQGGKRLRDAGKDEIEAAAHYYESASSDMAFKARWLRCIAEIVPPNTTAGAVLTEEKAAELRAAVEDKDA